MHEFAKLKGDALQLPDKFIKCHALHLGCFGFFSSLIPNQEALDQVETIAMFARSFDAEDEDNLFCYVSSITAPGTALATRFEEFKSQVLVGIYLVVWAHYQSSVASLVNKSLCDLIKYDLGVSSFKEMDEDLFHASLTALSQYCSFIYENRRARTIYDDLNQKLGVTIQADIETTRHARDAHDSSIYTYCAEMLSTFGINMS